MTEASFLVFFSGFLVFGAGVQLGVWHILAGPDRPNYPTGGKWKRRIMFLFMASLLYRGLELMTSAEVSRVAQPGLVIGAVMVFSFFNVMLVDHLRNWLPARTHTRIRQLLRVASCRPDKALEASRRSASIPGVYVQPAKVVPASLVELTLQGFTVAGPGDGPEVFR